MVGGTLYRKLLRDIGHSWGQFAAVSAVVMCAIVLFISLRIAYASLMLSRDSYYDRYHFADFFVHLEKAPETSLREVESIPGVWRVRGRIVKDVPLEVAGNDDAVVGRVISMPDRRDALINDIHLVTGSYFPGAAATEVIVNQRFCKANGLRTGDTFKATINERKETLRIVGTAYSPEYVYAIRTPQQFAPNDKNFAIVFARESFVEDAFNMTNSFNDLVGLLHPGANLDRVLDAVKERLDAYGVYHKYGRDRQLSNHYLSEELKGLRNSALVTPLIFLVVAALVIHIILRRMTELQRTQIGLLCALGFSKASIVFHYVLYALAVGVAGAAPGTVLGYLLAVQLVDRYNMFFRFPSLRVQFLPWVVVQAFVLSAGMCAFGAARAAWRIVKLQPAVAIRPLAPARTGAAVQAGVLASLRAKLPLLWRITTLNALRAPGRSLLTVLGVVTATVILVIGLSTNNFLDFIIDYQYRLVDRSDLHVDFVAERPEAALLDIAAVEGVRYTEGVLQFGAELRNGWRKKTVLVMGLPPESRLYRVYDTAGRRVALPADGLVIPERVARELHLSRGSTVLLDPYVKDKDERPATVRGVVDVYIGLSVYARRDYLAQLLGEAGVINGALVEVERAAMAQVTKELDDMPATTAVTATGAILGGFEETVSKMMKVTTFIISLFAAIIAFAVIYNASSVSIAEQERDLACLCSLGYERSDVARIATNDIMPLGLTGAVLGLPLGYLACSGLMRLYETDLYKLPAIVELDTYVTVLVMVLVFLLVARRISQRRVHRIDIVRRLKTLE